MVTKSFQSVGRWVALLTVSGVVLGGAGLIVSEWVIVGVEESLAADFAAVISIVGVLLLAPAIAAVFGLYEGNRAVSRLAVFEAAIGVLIGTVIYTMIALTLISQYSITPDGGWPGAVDIATVAGLVAITAVVAGSVAVAVCVNGEESTDDTSTSSRVRQPAA